MTWRRSQRTQPGRESAMRRHPSALHADDQLVDTVDAVTAVADRGLSMFELMGRARWGDLERVWRGFDQSPGAAMASARGL